MNATIVKNFLNEANRFNLVTFEEISSTNIVLFEEGRGNTPEWTVYVAEHQTEGKGRFDRKWESPRGVGLWFSLLLRPPIGARYANLINLLAAYTMAQFLEREIKKETGQAIPVNLKWPNDLQIENKKLCGILLQSNFSGDKLKYLVLGIGLNVNQALQDFTQEIRDTAISLRMATGIMWNREALLAGFLNFFHENYHHYFPDQYRQIVDLYFSKVLYKNQRIRVQTGEEEISGIFLRLTPEGYLVIQQDGKERIITTGDIFHNDTGKSL